MRSRTGNGNTNLSTRPSWLTKRHAIQNNNVCRILHNLTTFSNGQRKVIAFSESLSLISLQIYVPVPVINVQLQVQGSFKSTQIRVYCRYEWVGFEFHSLPLISQTSLLFIQCYVSVVWYKWHAFLIKDVITKSSVVILSKSNPLYGRVVPDVHQYLLKMIVEILCIQIVSTVYKLFF